MEKQSDAQRTTSTSAPNSPSSYSMEVTSGGGTPFEATRKEGTVTNLVQGHTSPLPSSPTLTEEEQQYRARQRKLQSVQDENKDLLIKVELITQKIKKHRAKEKARAKQKREMYPHRLPPSTPEDHVIDPDKVQLDESSPLGAGSFGKVYKGSWDKFTTVAIKVLAIDASSRVQAEQEVNLMSHIGAHPHCVKLYGSYAQENTINIVMEYADLGSLTQYMRGLGEELSYELRLDIAFHVASGLAFLHKKNFAHRDIAARNVLLASDQTYPNRIRAMISDFGFTRYRSPLSSSLNFDNVTTDSAHWRWMAPDLFDTRDQELPRLYKISAPADVWSYGVLLWEIGTGRLRSPHQDTSLSEFRAGKTMSLDGLPPLFQKLIRQCWNFDPEKRPTMDAIRDELYCEVEVAKKHTEMAGKLKLKPETKDNPDGDYFREDKS